MPVLPEDRELGPLLTRTGAASGMSTDHCGPKTSLPAVMRCTLTVVTVAFWYLVQMLTIGSGCPYSSHCSIISVSFSLNHFHFHAVLELK